MQLLRSAVHLTTNGPNMDTLSVESRGDTDSHGYKGSVAGKNENMRTMDSAVKVLCRSVSETHPVYQFQEPRRSVVRVDNYKRRLEHLKPGCGFFSCQIRPYQALGSPCLRTDYWSFAEIPDSCGTALVSE